MGTSFSIGSLAAQASAMQSTQDRTIQQVKMAGGGPNQDAKIDKGAKEFEAMLLGTWLQQAEQSFATVPGADGDEDAAGKDQMMSLGVQQLATSLAASGGIGIAKMVAKAMHAAADKVASQADSQQAVTDHTQVEEKR
jgi:Rod binding domain-containing protein